jgi:ubiquinone/menaquinone biosynthesis C-methylase UbiE
MCGRSLTFRLELGAYGGYAPFPTPYTRHPTPNTHDLPCYTAHCTLHTAHCPLHTAHCPLTMSTIQQDFDRIALVSTDGATQNGHYHNFLLRHLPLKCHDVLEIGCGTGAFARLLAKRSQNVLALDLSPEMIRIARESSTEFPNIEFELADVRDRVLPLERFDCIVTIATLHHLRIREVLLKMKAALKPGGVLLILDLFEPERNLLEPEGLLDASLNVLALAVSGTLRLVQQGRLLPRREVRDAWAEHLRHDIYPTMSQIRELCSEILPGAKVRKHLLWRYSIVWKKGV